MCSEETIGNRREAIGNRREALRQAQGGQAQGGQAQGGQAQGGPDAAALGRALVAGVDRLHVERGELVRQARELRLKGEHAAREAVWERVQEITLQIEQSEADIASFGGREALAGGPSAGSGQAGAEGEGTAWRDENVDIPDDECTVVLRVTCDEEDLIEVGHREAGAWCINGADPEALGVSVIGWMHMHEAVEILDAAARGEVANG